MLMLQGSVCNSCNALLHVFLTETASLLLTSALIPLLRIQLKLTDNECMQTCNRPLHAIFCHARSVPTRRRGLLCCMSARAITHDLLKQCRTTAKGHAKLPLLDTHSVKICCKADCPCLSLGVADYLESACCKVCVSVL